MVNGQQGGSCSISLTVNPSQVQPSNQIALEWDSNGDVANGARVFISSTDDTRPVFNFSSTNLDGFKSGNAPATAGTYTYRASVECGNGSTATDNAVLTVNNPTPTNNPPVANDDSRSADVNQTININVLSNDTDPDGDDLDLASVNSPSGGTIVDYDIETGVVEYKTPATAGTYYFDYTVTDGQATDVATVTIIVNPGPQTCPANFEAVNDVVTIQVGQSRPLNVLDNDINVGSFAGPSVVTGNASVSFSDGVGPLYNFTGEAVGSYTFTYSVNCPGDLGTDTATVTINVVAVPQVCTVDAQNDSYTINVGQTVTRNVAVNDTFTTGQTTFIDNNVNGNSAVSFSDNMGPEYSFTGLSEGTYTFTYTIDCNSGTNQDTATVTITVNDNPSNQCSLVTAVNDSYSIRTNRMSTFDVLSNDSTSNTDDEPLSIDAITNGPNNGTATIVSGRIQYTPDSGYEGTDTFTYRAENDCGNVDTATVTVTIGRDNNGGGGGGGGILRPRDNDDDDGEVLGDDEVNLDIFNERLTRLSDSKYVISWNTNIPATSQVVYGMRSVSNPTGQCGSSNLGYQQRTNEKTNLTTTHVMIVDGLTPGAQYFFRPVSDRNDTDCAKGRELTYRPADICEGYIRDFMKIGQYNDPREVAKLQAFLKIYEGANIRLTGTFDVATDRAVKDFQVKYYGEVLEPWGYDRDEATGYVYITTRNKINEIICDRDIPFTSAQLSEIAAFRSFWNNRFPGEVLGAAVATQPLTTDYGYDKAGGTAADLIPASDANSVSTTNDADGEVIVLGGTDETDDIISNTIADEEFFLDNVTTDNEVSAETSAERELAEKSVAGAAAAGFISFIFSLPFLLTVLAVLILMLIYEVIKDRKARDNEVNNEEVVVVENEPAVPTRN